MSHKPAAIDATHFHGPRYMLAGCPFELNLYKKWTGVTHNYSKDQKTSNATRWGYHKETKQFMALTAEDISWQYKFPDEILECETLLATYLKQEKFILQSGISVNKNKKPFKTSLDQVIFLNTPSFRRLWNGREISPAAAIENGKVQQQIKELLFKHNLELAKKNAQLQKSIQQLKQEAIFARIECIGIKIDSYVQLRLNHKKSFFVIVIENLHPQLFHEWIGKYDGETRFGQTFKLNYNGKQWTTGPNAAPWMFWQIVNKGEVKDYMVDNTKHRIQNFSMESVGKKEDKARVRADFTFKNHNDDWVPLLK